MKPKLLLTCEHGGNQVPAALRQCFRGARAVLASHRGWDPGALELAHTLAAATGAPLLSVTVSRLVIELNRSLHHPRLFSEFTSLLNPASRAALIDGIYRPHRAAVEQVIAASAARGIPTLHLGVHTFTPVLDGERRNCDVGLLYDPRRAREKDFCLQFAKSLRQAAPALVIRRNYPYRGAADGLTTNLRRVFSQSCYLGIELEVNQRWALGPRRAWKQIQQSLAQALATAIA